MYSTFIFLGKFLEFLLVTVGVANTKFDNGNIFSVHINIFFFLFLIYRSLVASFICFIYSRFSASLYVVFYFIFLAIILLEVKRRCVNGCIVYIKKIAEGKIRKMDHLVYCLGFVLCLFILFYFFVFVVFILLTINNIFFLLRHWKERSKM